MNAPVLPVQHTQAMATFVADLRYADLPPDVQERARLTLLDTLGVMLAAVALPAGRNALRAGAFLGPHLFSARTPQSGDSPVASALVLGTLSDVLEIQDGWRHGGIHACLLIGAALPVALSLDRSGSDLLTAIVAGYEVCHRAAWACHPQHMASGYMPNGTAGTIGSAAAAGWLMNLNAAQIAGALGNAGFLLPVSTAENLWSGYSAKPLHSGQAAKTGVESAYYATLGFNGCPLEGSPQRGKGYLEITSGAPQLERLSEGLGERYTLRETYFKFYPICRQAQAAAEAALQVASQLPNGLDDVISVDLETYALSAQLLTRQVSAESGMVAAQFSLPYILAATLKHGEMSLRQLQLDVLQDQQILDLAKRVTIRVDGAMSALYPDRTPAKVTVTLKDGRCLIARCDSPRGDPSAPPGEAELVQKFRDLCAEFIDQELVNRLIEQVLTLDQQPSLVPLVSTLRRLLRLE
jgi:2-methylcitrate dehydratase PrpD